MSDKEDDRWADWLVRGRQRGLADKQVREMHRQLHRLRTRVLRSAKLRPGDVVLDVGAGTGLLALEARRRVKAEGRVVASDISIDALAYCRSAAPPGAPVLLVAGDALALPFPDQTFDVVMTRSVLIYLERKQGAVRELHRVLKTRGRVSIFEPINEVWRRNEERLAASNRFDDFQPTHARVRERLRSSPARTFTGWDERDLVGWFEDAGFGEVTLNYEYASLRPPPPKRITEAARTRMRAWWQARPNPHSPSFSELVHEILEAEADEYLERFLEFTLANPPPTATGAAYLSARRL